MKQSKRTVRNKEKADQKIIQTRLKMLDEFQELHYTILYVSFHEAYLNPDGIGSVVSGFSKEAFSETMSYWREIAGYFNRSKITSITKLPKLTDEAEAEYVNNVNSIAATIYGAVKAEANKAENEYQASQLLRAIEYYVTPGAEKSTRKTNSTKKLSIDNLPGAKYVSYFLLSIDSDMYMFDANKLFNNEELTKYKPKDLIRNIETLAEDIYKTAELDDKTKAILTDIMNNTNNDNLHENMGRIECIAHSKELVTEEFVKSGKYYTLINEIRCKFPVVERQGIYFNDLNLEMMDIDAEDSYIDKKGFFHMGAKEMNIWRPFYSPYLDKSRLIDMNDPDSLTETYTDPKTGKQKERLRITYLTEKEQEEKKNQTKEERREEREAALIPLLSKQEDNIYRLIKTKHNEADLLYVNMRALDEYLSKEDKINLEFKIRATVFFGVRTNNKKYFMPLMQSAAAVRQGTICFMETATAPISAASSAPNEPQSLIEDTKEIRLMWFKIVGIKENKSFYITEQEFKQMFCKDGQNAVIAKVMARIAQQAASSTDLSEEIARIKESNPNVSIRLEQKLANIYAIVYKDKVTEVERTEGKHDYVNTAMTLEKVTQEVKRSDGIGAAKLWLFALNALCHGIISVEEYNYAIDAFYNYDKGEDAIYVNYALNPECIEKNSRLDVILMKIPKQIQIRFGGCKGTIIWCPDLESFINKKTGEFIDILMPESVCKFPSLKKGEKYMIMDTKDGEGNPLPFAVCGMSNQRHKNWANLNVQSINGLIPKCSEFFNEMLNELTAKIVAAMTTRAGAMALLSCPESFGIDDETACTIYNLIGEALKTSAKLIKDPFVKNTLYDVIRNICAGVFKGQIPMKGQTIYMASDPTAILTDGCLEKDEDGKVQFTDFVPKYKAKEYYDMLTDEKSFIPKGRLVYLNSNDIKASEDNETEAVAFRNPKVSVYELAWMKLIWNKHFLKYRYHLNIVIFNVFDMMADVMGGADFDGDRCFITTSAHKWGRRIIEAVRNAMDTIWANHVIIVSQEDALNVPLTLGNIYDNMATFGVEKDRTGEITNYGTKWLALAMHYYYSKVLCQENGCHAINYVHPLVFGNGLGEKFTYYVSNMEVNGVTVKVLNVRAPIVCKIDVKKAKGWVRINDEFMDEYFKTHPRDFSGRCEYVMHEQSQEDDSKFEVLSTQGLYLMVDEANNPEEYNAIMKRWGNIVTKEDGTLKTGYDLTLKAFSCMFFNEEMRALQGQEIDAAKHGKRPTIPPELKIRLTPLAMQLRSVCRKSDLEELANKYNEGKEDKDKVLIAPLETDGTGYSCVSPWGLMVDHFITSCIPQVNEAYRTTMKTTNMVSYVKSLLTTNEKKTLARLSKETTILNDITNIITGYRTSRQSAHNAQQRDKFSNVIQSDNDEDNERYKETLNIIDEMFVEKVYDIAKKYSIANELVAILVYCLANCGTSETTKARKEGWLLTKEMLSVFSRDNSKATLISVPTNMQEISLRGSDVIGINAYGEERIIRSVKNLGLDIEAFQGNLPIIEKIRAGKKNLVMIGEEFYKGKDVETDDEAVCEPNSKKNPSKGNTFTVSLMGFNEDVIMKLDNSDDKTIPERTAELLNKNPVAVIRRTTEYNSLALLILKDGVEEFICCINENSITNPSIKDKDKNKSILYGLKLEHKTVNITTDIKTKEELSRMSKEEQKKVARVNDASISNVKLKIM